MAEEKELNDKLSGLEKEADDLVKSGGEGDQEEREQKHGELRKVERKKDDAMARLGEVQGLLVEIDADSGPSRAAELLAGLGFSTADQVSAYCSSFLDLC
jgi:ATP-binding cassette subfamily F protein 3